jgi:hypothetical protein
MTHVAEALRANSKGAPFNNWGERLTPVPQGGIKLHFRGRGQLVPDCVDLSLQGQAVPAPVCEGFEMELDAAVPAPGRESEDIANR